MQKSYTKKNEGWTVMVTPSYFFFFSVKLSKRYTPNYLFPQFFFSKNYFA